ncbi:MAG: DUF4870 domain-containing protein [Tannerella sp.]|jgi:uncharacterized Tic20 family protein|nr:DUF4870 domain-containing protein [Tannerella sp.]
MNIYDELEKLKKLLDDGTVTREEFEREKARILASAASGNPPGWDIGIDERTFAALMHASQFMTSFILPLVLWLLFKDKSRYIDAHGKKILNFEMSYAIYTVALCLTCIGLFAVPVVAVAMLVFIVIGIIKALNGETWTYPLSIPFLK